MLSIKYFQIRYLCKLIVMGGIALACGSGLPNIWFMGCIETMGNRNYTCVRVLPANPSSFQTED